MAFESQELLHLTPRQTCQRPLYELVVLRKGRGYTASVYRTFDTFISRFGRSMRRRIEKTSGHSFSLTKTGGRLAASIVHPREVFKPAVLVNAVSARACGPSRPEKMSD
jgi:hypothetical protein